MQWTLGGPTLPPASGDSNISSLINEHSSTPLHSTLPMHSASKHFTLGPTTHNPHPSLVPTAQSPFHPASSKLPTGYGSAPMNQISGVSSPPAQSVMHPSLLWRQSSPPKVRLHPVNPRLVRRDPTKSLFLEIVEAEEARQASEHLMRELTRRSEQSVLASSARLQPPPQIGAKDDERSRQLKLLRRKRRRKLPVKTQKALERKRLEKEHPEADCPSSSASGRKPQNPTWLNPCPNPAASQQTWTSTRMACLDAYLTSARSCNVNLSPGHIAALEMVFSRPHTDANSFETFQNLPTVHKCTGDCDMEFLDDVYRCRASGRVHWCTSTNCERCINHEEEQICPLSTKSYGFTMSGVAEIKLRAYYDAKRTKVNDDAATMTTHVDSDMHKSNPSYVTREPTPRTLPKRLQRSTYKKKPQAPKAKRRKQSTPGAKRIKSAHSSKIRAVVRAVLKEDKAKGHQTEALITLIQLLWDIYDKVPGQDKTTAPYTIENHTLVTLYTLERGIKISDLVFIPVVNGLQLVGLKNLYQVRIGASRHPLQTRHVTKAESILRNALRRAQTSPKESEEFFCTLQERQAHIKKATALLLSHL